MKIVDVTGCSLIEVDGKLEKYWVYQLVREAVKENLDRVRNLDWFHLSQLVGDQTWDYLAAREQLQSAGRCFKYMVKTHCVPIDDVSRPNKDTKRYKVANSSDVARLGEVALSIVIE